MWLCHAKPLQYLDALGKFSKSPRLLQSRSFSDLPFRKSKLAPLQERRMIDRCSLRAKGGDGGNGCYSFRRSRHDRRGRPDGGNGGRGGDVILEASPTLWDFSSLQHHINAKSGGHGVSKNKIGSRGSDKVVLVPVGTVIHLVEGEIPSVVVKSSSSALDPWDIPGTLDTHLSDSSQQLAESVGINVASSSSIEASIVKSANVKQHKRAPSIEIEESIVHEQDFDSSKEGASEWEDHETDEGMSEAEWEEEMEEEEHIQYNVAELTEPGQQITVAQGGDGGLGNVSYSKGPQDTEVSDDDQNPSPSAGTPGSEVKLILELKSIADVGLVGMPNAGKSTLLGAISRAKPNVGHYAFTTLRPNLGNLNYEDFSVTVADIPGIIKGAHENRGLGHAFLRHIERTKVLAYVVDLAAALDGRKGTPPWEQLRDLISELEFYQEGLSDRPSLVVANKIDEAGADQMYEELKRRVSGVPIFPVCAVLEEGVMELKAGLRMLVSGEELHKLNLDDIELE